MDNKSLIRCFGMKYLYSLLLVHILTIPPEIGFVCSCDRSMKLSIPFFLLLYLQNTFLSIVITRNRTEIAEEQANNTLTTLLIFISEHMRITKLRMT